MTIRLALSLDDQAIGLNRNVGNLVIAQRWSGFPRGMHAELFFRFTAGEGRNMQLERPGTPSLVLEQFRKATAAMAHLTITEAKARKVLSEWGLPAEEFCTEPLCQALLPLGGRYCRACSRPYHVRVAGTQQFTFLPATARTRTGAST